MTRHPKPPPMDELTYAQHQGWACCWCGTSLWTAVGGISVGRSPGPNGTSIEVYACSRLCPQRPTTQTPARPDPRAQQGRAGSTASHRRQPSTTGGIT
ncbi:hypothetical protein [Streptomyces sp. NRRL S-813]|uniref:hypothetical protein n=1 Tax=Streptomyces sp. NRRL S-813 TaxID=1463919 RepID=UPI000D1B20D0|nr:hypothetical protein [Streptomyces sp. NRRL S-813]